MKNDRVRQALDEWAASNGYALTVRWLAATDEGNDVWVTVTDGEAGAEMRLTIDAAGEISVVDSDSRLESAFPSEILFAGGRSCDTNPSDVPGVPSSPAIPNGYGRQQALAFVANAFIDKLSSKNAPCTDGGNLACAWAVHHVITSALGSGLGSTSDMLATKNMYAVLRRVAAEVAWNDAGAGDIVISPTNGIKIGHVGILIDSGNICSNSSAAKMWKQNYSKASWKERYDDRKGLPVLAFRM